MFGPDSSVASSGPGPSGGENALVSAGESPSGANSSVKSYFPVKPVLSITGSLSWPVRFCISAKTGTAFAVKRAMDPFGPIVIIITMPGRSSCGNPFASILGGVPGPNWGGAAGAGTLESTSADFLQFRSALARYQFVTLDFFRLMVQSQVEPLRQQILKHQIKLLFGCAGWDTGGNIVSFHIEPCGAGNLIVFNVVSPGRSVHR